MIRRLAPSGRVIVLGTPPEDAATPREATAQRALEGFVRSLGKEVGRGATAQLRLRRARRRGRARVDAALPALRPLGLRRPARSSASAPAAADVPDDWERPLAGQVARRHRRRRAASARRSPRCWPATARTSSASTSRPRARTLAAIANAHRRRPRCSSTSPPTDAPAALAEHLRERHGGVDIVVHNAGITRDKTLGAHEPRTQWDSVLAVNLAAQERINDALLDGDVLRPGGRIVSVSSMSGIAGNRGQTNYATSQGRRDRHRRVAGAGARRARATINAVAPGFIETQMTAAMPLGTREAGRRMNSLAQGGLPVDVAETVAWLAQPGVGGRQRQRRAGLRPEPARRMSADRALRAPALLPLSGARSSAPAAATTLPDRRARAARVEVDRDALAEYDRGVRLPLCATSCRRRTRTCSRSRWRWS